MKKIETQFSESLIIILKIFGLAIFIYLIVAPFYPEIKYQIYLKRTINEDEVIKFNPEPVNNLNKLPESKYLISSERLIIPKIGVNAPIIISDDEKYGLAHGAWLIPLGSTPDQGGNTIITGHRFKYLPPNSTTFYLFDKLKVGDIFYVLWKDKSYFYKVREIKIIPASDSSPYYKSEKAILTMYTCNPIYSTKERLVIISDLIKIE